MAEPDLAAFYQRREKALGGLVGCRVKSGPDLLTVSSSLFDPQRTS
jgi:hypothetical protein